MVTIATADETVVWRQAYRRPPKGHARTPKEKRAIDFDPGSSVGAYNLGLNGRAYPGGGPQRYSWLQGLLARYTQDKRTSIALGLKLPVIPQALIDAGLVKVESAAKAAPSKPVVRCWNCSTAMEDRGTHHRCPRCGAMI